MQQTVMMQLYAFQSDATNTLRLPGSLTTFLFLSKSTIQPVKANKGVRPETHRAEIRLKLVGPPSSGTEGGVEAGEVLIAAHLQEGRQVMRGEADEVQVACPAAQCQVLQLQVHVPDTRFAISGVGGQVAPDAFQVLHLFLLLLSCDVFGLKVHQFHQSASDVHSKPGKCCSIWDNICKEIVHQTTFCKKKQKQIYYITVHYYHHKHYYDA